MDSRYSLKKNAPSKSSNERMERKQAIQQLFQPRNCKQSVLIPKINIYLAQKNRPLLDIDPGHCHGLTLLWLYKMATGEVEWFYNIIEKIISSSSYHLRTYDEDIEKFIHYIEWGQNSIKYTQHMKTRIHQSNVDKILGITQVEEQYKKFNYPELYHFLEKNLYKNHMIILSCWDKKIMHTIGIFISGPFYFLYDPNYRSGRPTVFSSPLLLIHEIRRCMYEEFKEPLPLFYMPLEIHVLNALEAEKNSKIAQRSP